MQAEKAIRYFIILLCCYRPSTGRAQYFSTNYAGILVSRSGYITRIRDKSSKKNYVPPGDSSALLSLYKNKTYILPVSAAFDPDQKKLTLAYPNGSLATILMESRGSYLRMQLVSLSPRNGVDNIVWGPYKTSISQTIGEIISVVRDNHFSIGLQALDEITTSGPPSDGDLYQSYYLIHAPPDVKLPPDLHEGQIFHIGGDSLGSSDIAFFSRPEEYFRYTIGNGAYLTPYGSDIVLHARDRRIAQTINFKPSIASPDRHQYVAPLDVDFIGSAVAFFGCPEPLTLSVIGKIELREGLPHPLIDGRWVKDPRSAKPFIAWYGVHDSAISYARQLGFEAIQDEGLGEYYYNPADKWDGKRVNFSNTSLSIPEYTALTNKAGIAYGLHTLCEFIQPGSSEVTPVPNDHLARVGSTLLTHAIGASDTVIEIADPAYLRESGGWEDIHTNILKIDHELISYEGVSAGKPYTLLHPVRGWDHTKAEPHAAKDSVHKLMPNAYHGFAPDIFLQDKYARAYAQLLNEGGMNYIDFDGLESCWYQGHGQYSIKRFYDTLFRHLHHYIRNTGSCIFEGNWHYMSSLDVGGNLFDPATNEYSIEGKDFKHIYYSNLLHFSFGLVSFSPDWDSAVAENLEARAVGWDGQYMLGLSQEDVEKCAGKQAIFKAIRIWEEARAANLFTAAQKEQLRNPDNHFHLEQTGRSSWTLRPVKEISSITGIAGTSRTIIKNPYTAQQACFSIRIKGGKGDSVNNPGLQINKGKVLVFHRTLRAGQFIIGAQGKVWLADENRHKIPMTEMNNPSILPHADNEVKLTAVSPDGHAMQYEQVFSFLGPPEKLEE